MRQSEHCTLSGTVRTSARTILLKSARLDDCSVDKVSVLAPWSTREGAEGFKCADFEMIGGLVDFEGTGGHVDIKGAGGVVILTVEFVLIVPSVVTTEADVSLLVREEELDTPTFGLATPPAGVGAFENPPGIEGNILRSTVGAQLESPPTTVEILLDTSVVIDEESERLSGVANELELPLFVVTIFESFLVVAVAYDTPPTDPTLSDLLRSVSEVGEKSLAEVTTGTDCE